MSRIISFLRFPLIALVVIIHTDLTDIYFGGLSIVDPSLYPMYTAFRNFLQEVLRMVVPVFFMVSGYLFCAPYAEFDRNAYVGKIKNRVRTLLVPYLLWITIVLAVNALGPVLLPSLASGRQQPYEFTLATFVRDYWVHPACIQFWFLRDLMVVCLLSLPLLGLVRRLGLLWLGAMALVYVSEAALGYPFPAGFSPCALLFFSAGAWYRYYVHPDVMQSPCGFPFRLRRAQALAIASAYVVLVLLATHLQWGVSEAGGSDIAMAVSRLSVLVGVPLVLCVCRHFAVDRGCSVPAIAASATFFVYGSHMFILAFAERLIVKALPESDLLFVLAYVAVPALVVCVCVALSACVRACCPSLWALLTCLLYTSPSPRDS